MLRHCLAGGLICAAAFGLPSVSFANEVCGTRDRIVATLAGSYGEVRSGLGVQGQRSVIELWTSEETGSWTILMTWPDGMSCVLASGNYWEANRPRGAVPSSDPV